MIQTLNPTFIFPASLIPTHKHLFHFHPCQDSNLITGDGKYREYNEFNQLVRVRAGYDENGRVMEEYVYHPTEERILAKKVYDFDQHLIETIIYANENLVRKINSSGTYDTVNQFTIELKKGETDHAIN